MGILIKDCDILENLSDSEMSDYDIKTKNNFLSAKSMKAGKEDTVNRVSDLK